MSVFQAGGLQPVTMLRKFRTSYIYLRRSSDIGKTAFIEHKLKGTPIMAMEQQRGNSERFADNFAFNLGANI
jgi:hypothetical protein